MEPDEQQRRRCREAAALGVCTEAECLDAFRRRAAEGLALIRRVNEALAVDAFRRMPPGARPFIHMTPAPEPGPESETPSE